MKDWKECPDCRGTGYDYKKLCTRRLLLTVKIREILLRQRPVNRRVDHRPSEIDRVRERRR